MCFKNKLFLLIVFFFMLVLFLPIFFIPENLGGGKRGKSVCQSTTLILVLNTFESCQWLYQTSLCVLLCGKLSFVFSVNHQWERVQSITLGVLGTLDSKRLGYSTLEWKQESTKVAWRVSRTVRRCLCMWHVEVCLWLCDRLETLLFLLTVPCYASWPRRHIAPRPYRSAHLGGLSLSRHLVTFIGNDKPGSRVETLIGIFPLGKLLFKISPASPVMGHCDRLGLLWFFQNVKTGRGF